MATQYELEEQQLEDDLANGDISTSEYNSSMRSMQRQYREEARESAEEAYHDEMGRW